MMTSEPGVLHDGEIEAQRRFGVTREGQAMSRVLRDRLSPGMTAFIEAQPFFFIATANDRGDCDCSFRGSQHPDPALKVIDPTTLVFPDYSGNNLYNSLGNILSNPHIGLLFVDFAHPARARVNGRAEIIEDPAVYQTIWPEALRYVKVSVVQAFPNCKQRVPMLVPTPPHSNDDANK